MEIESFRDLRVWHGGIDLVVHTYRLTETFPQREVYGLGSQMERAAFSVPSNIAEGHTREHRKEYLQHLATSQASLAELETHLEIARRLQYASHEEIESVLQEAGFLGKQLYALRNALRRKEPEGRNRSPKR